MIHSRIAGTGSYLPEKVITNFDLEKMVDTTDEWILSRTGIERRHLAAASQTTCDLAEAAARRAMQAAGVGPSDIDFIALGTTTPDQVFPNTACLVQAPGHRRTACDPGGGGLYRLHLRLEHR